MKRAVFALALCAYCKHPEPAEVTVGAAISLKESMDDAAPGLAARSAAKVTFAFGASGELASQMERGAPFDVLVAAGEESRLASIADESCTLVWNTLALVKRSGSVSVDWSALRVAPRAFRLAIGLTPTVPAGVYAEEALHRLGAWDAVAPKVLRGTNVRNVLDLVARGEADEGIVYATDVKIRSDVELVALVPASARPNVRYPVYVSKRASPKARDVARFICDDETRHVLASRGFMEHAP